MARTALAHLPNVTVNSFTGLLVDFLRQRKSSIVIRGLRALSDFEYEFQMALANKQLCPTAETVFLTTAPQNLYLSSSMVKQIAGFGGDISGFVPEQIREAIVQRLDPKFHNQERNVL